MNDPDNFWMDLRNRSVVSVWFVRQNLPGKRRRDCLTHSPLESDSPHVLLLISTDPLTLLYCDAHS